MPPGRRNKRKYAIRPLDFQVLPRCGRPRLLRLSKVAYREADIKPKRLELYPVLVENLEQLQRFPEALAMMREYRQLTEELASVDTRARVAELQTAFDLARKERELLESERERLAREAEVDALQAEQSRERLLGVFFLAGVIVLGLFLIAILRSLSLRTKANQLLAEKNAEIDLQQFDLALKIADAALYEIKDRGRNGWTGFERRAHDPQVFKGSPDIEALVERDALARKRTQSPATGAP